MEADFLLSQIARLDRPARFGATPPDSLLATPGNPRRLNATCRRL
ncbi:hypothetical protein [Burkholderia sp. IMCC1007]|nr:hypothetical protein [Burkholderia sp. IMCC1007]